MHVVNVRVYQMCIHLRVCALYSNHDTIFASNLTFSEKCVHVHIQHDDNETRVRAAARKTALAVESAAQAVWQ